MKRAFRIVRVGALAFIGAGLGGPAAAQTATSTGADPLSELARLNAQIDALEARIVETSGEVDLLKETALTGRVGRTYADVVHRDELGSGYRLQSLRYVLDGRVLMERSSEDGKPLRAPKTLPLYRGAIEPGEHLLEVEAVVKSGTFGIFTYAEGYKFEVRSRYVLDVREGRLNKLSIVFHQKPDVTLSAEERLGVRYDLAVEEGLPIEATSRAAP